MIDVIVTTYNRLNLLKKAMESFFLNTNLDLVNKIIISNDGSTDGTGDYLEQLCGQFPKIVVLPQQSERWGIVPRFNEALKLCTSNTICEFQDDIEFTPKWLESQLDHLDICHFVTGFDAPEHRSFRKGSGYVIKHSSRFTQLLARKAVWDQWFPMKPSHPFPTPTFKDGKQIGSNIDANLYNRRKNRASGSTTFLVIPGLIRHNAEDENSTWRLPATVAEYTGGLRPEEVRQYWRDRCRKQGGIAVGFAGRPTGEQKEILRQKKDFILPHIDTTLHVIDYGCGVGHFSRCFDPAKYTGFDITEEFLIIAEQNNPGYYYSWLPKPLLETDRPFEMFFTTNVLQHNSNQAVDELLSSVKQTKEKDFVFALYENIHDYTGTKHMCFRRPKDYINFVGRHFKVKRTEIFQHVVHNEAHALIKIFV